MMHPADGHDALALSMFWTGLLMVFAPLIFAGTIIGVAWRQRRRGIGTGIPAPSFDTALAPGILKAEPNAGFGRGGRSCRNDGQSTPS